MSQRGHHSHINTDPKALVLASSNEWVKRDTEHAMQCCCCINLASRLVHISSLSGSNEGCIMSSAHAEEQKQLCECIRRTK